MYTNIQLNFIAETKEYYKQSYNAQKRLREEQQETKDIKKRQPKTFFRPWSDEETEAVAKNSKDTPYPTAHQPQQPLTNAAPYQFTSYQMAMLQQQRQTALAFQQAMYQRQLFQAQFWAQHHQMLLHHQQQMRQQMLIYGPAQGH